MTIAISYIFSIFKILISLFEDAGDGQRRLVGFNITCDHDDEGSVAFDTGAMLVMQIERGLRER